MKYLDGIKPTPKDSLEYHNQWKNWQASLLAALKKRRIQIEVKDYECDPRFER
jgi:hypothetical protein